jgi:hypothetical protein
MDTLKQALPDNDPLPDRLVSALQDFRQFHTRLWEWKELHNALNEVIFVFDQFSKEVERRDASSNLGDVRALRRLWHPVDQKVELLLDLATKVQRIGSPLVTLPDGSRQGPPWAIELASVTDQLKHLFEEGVPTSTISTKPRMPSRTPPRSTCIWRISGCATAGELYNLSNALLGSVVMTKFDELQQGHQQLLDRVDKVVDRDTFVHEVQGYVTRVRDEAEYVPAPRDRDQLRANLRFWASYLYDATGRYPNTTMPPARPVAATPAETIAFTPPPASAPPPPSSAPMVSARSRGKRLWITVGIIAGIIVCAAIVVVLPGALGISPSGRTSHATKRQAYNLAARTRT